MSGISVATIKNPEFINVSSISPLISKCEVKVLYVGENRNKSFITKEVAKQMAQTLPGTPIVGYWMENKEDFGDHGDQVVIDGDGVRFNKLTKPYGFVAPNAKIWFQEFEDTDDFGKVTIREYLMTEGYLWTEMYEECKRVISDGNPQSMELDKNSLKGHWSTVNNSGVEFFIINDAMFLNLCILGEDVEPCFEGADITSPNISSSFSKDTNAIVRSLSDMMTELKFALKGEQENNMGNVIPETEVIKQPVENFSENQDKVYETSVVENQNNTEAFAKKEEEENKDDKSSEDKKEKEDEDDKDKFSKSDEDDKEDESKKDEEEKKTYSLEEYSALETQFSELQDKYALLEQTCQELTAFKNKIEDSEKDELINSFCMLSDEDKEDVISNKSKYSLDEIEAKLSVICYRKKINFDNSKEEQGVAGSASEAPMTYNLNETESSAVPAWIKAIQATKEQRNK